MVLWVFAYGSLVWNPGFDFDERIVGFIKDYERVFNLGKCCLSINKPAVCINFDGKTNRSSFILQHA